MTVLDEGDAQPKRTRADELADRIADTLTTHGGELTRKDLIQRTGEHDNSTFDKALERAADQHRITKTNRGRYALGPGCGCPASRRCDSLARLECGGGAL